MNRPVTYYVPLTATELETVKNALQFAIERLEEDIEVVMDESYQGELKRLKALSERLG